MIYYGNISELKLITRSITTTAMLLGVKLLDNSWLLLFDLELLDLTDHVLDVLVDTEGV